MIVLQMKMSLQTKKIQKAITIPQKKIHIIVLMNIAHMNIVHMNIVHMNIALIMKAQKKVPQNYRINNK